MDATHQSPFAFRLVAVLMLGATLALAYSSGPPDGKTGRPGEGTCNDCHSGVGSADSTELVGQIGRASCRERVYVTV